MKKAKLYISIEEIEELRRELTLARTFLIRDKPAEFNIGLAKAHIEMALKLMTVED